MRVTRPCRLGGSGGSARAHALLGLSDGRAYTAAELRRAFYRKAQQLHPDAGGSAGAFRELHEAYRTLQLTATTTTTTQAAAAAASRNAHSSHSSHNDDRAAHAQTWRDDGDAYSSSAGFYTNAHSQWERHMAQRRRYWRAQYEQQRQQQQQQQHMHDARRHDARRHDDSYHHTHTYGAGLGDDFVRASGWSSEHARWRASARAYVNFASWYAYRPYESCYHHNGSSSCLGHGFDDDELRDAVTRSRRARRVRAVKCALLLAPLAWLVYVYRRNNRIARCTRARALAYRDDDYWRSVNADDARGSGDVTTQQQQQQQRRRALRHGTTQWLSPQPPQQPSSSSPHDSDEARAATATPCTAAAAASTTTTATRATVDAATATTLRDDTSRRTRRTAPSSQQQPQLQYRSSSHAVWHGGAVRYRGRPFTPTHVRGLRGRADKTRQSYAADVTCNVDDDDDDDDEGDNEVAVA